MVRRKGVTQHAMSPFYRYIATMGDVYIAEYCGQLKELPVSLYEVVCH